MYLESQLVKAQREVTNVVEKLAFIGAQTTSCMVRRHRFLGAVFNCRNSVNVYIMLAVQNSLFLCFISYFVFFLALFIFL
jgi:hypothetical protein